MALNSSPVDVAAHLKANLFTSDQIKSVILTSATLAVGRGGGQLSKNKDQRSKIMDDKLDAGPASVDSESKILNLRSQISDAARPPDKNESPFAFFRKRIGLDTGGEIQLGSPFDYPNQVTLYLETNLPDPEESAFLNAAMDRAMHYIRQSQGRA
ncbi:helicase c2, partial [mine drainage metagenome]